jgi:hypothetical protein
MAAVSAKMSVGKYVELDVEGIFIVFHWLR